MKKISLVALFAALVMSVNATDIWTGSKHVSWDDGGVQIAADQFTAAQPGQKIVVSFNGASDGIEFKVMRPPGRQPRGSLDQRRRRFRAIPHTRCGGQSQSVRTGDHRR